VQKEVKEKTSLKQKASYYYLLHAGNSLTYYQTLSMGAKYSSETYVDFQLATRHCIPEDRTLLNHRLRTSNPAFSKLVSQWRF
jgi:hypothetical protein